MCDIPLESSRRGLQLCFRPHFDPRSAHKVMGFQSRGSPNWRDFGTPTRESRERKAIWMWAPWRGAKNTIKGKVVASPKFGLWWVLCVRVAHGSVLQLCTNHLVWVVCKLVWMSEAYQPFLVPSWSSNMPLYPSKCCELRNVPRLLPLPLSCTWTHFGVLQGVGNASQFVS